TFKGVFRVRKLLVSGILILIVLSGCSTEESIKTEGNKIEELASDYLEALESKDISAILKYTDDLRFPDKEKQIKHYSNIEEEITYTQILDLIKVNGTEFEATVEIGSDGDLNEHKFPIVKQGKDWKI